MSSDVAIQVENLAKCYHIYDQPRDRLLQMFSWGRRQYYREFWALKDVTFNVDRGETVGIIGRNGSGKSTLLQMICGTLNPTNGKIQANGRVAALLELGAGFNPEFTGRENVYMNAAIMGLLPSDIDACFGDIAAFADIGEFIEQPVKTYSSGMYVRLAFAVAIHVDPEILVVDEALAVGDIRFQLKCQRKMDELRDRGKTILLVSHSGADVVRLCSRAIWLEGGQVRTSGNPKRVVEEYSAWMMHDTGVQTSTGVDTGLGAVKSDLDDLIVPIPCDAFITGDGGAEIVAVGLLSEDNRRLAVISGRERVRVVIKVVARSRIEFPYLAFQIINAKGLRVMGCNTPILGKRFDPLEEGQSLTVSFSFTFPEISNDSYVLAVGVADGTPENHVRHQFVADAYEFRVLSTSLFQKQDVLVKLNDCTVRVEE